MSNKLVLVGGGGHCASVIDTVLTSTEYEEIVITDKESVGKKLLGIPIVGTDDCLEKLFQKGFTDAFITVGSIGDPNNRRRIYNQIKKIGFNVPNIIDKTASVSKNVNLGEGIFIGKQAVVNSLAEIGNNCIINTAAVIEHQCSLGEFVHVAPHAVLCGNTAVGDGSHIGAGSVIRQQIKIGKNVTIGAGSVAVKNIADGKTAYGNPCKEKEK
ncbi:MAG: acetyltransferase [Oscillospiraceae bacterium]|nr:acetyltransferase [Oscillospiraceae bacterium]